MIVSLVDDDTDFCEAVREWCDTETSYGAAVRLEVFHTVEEARQYLNDYRIEFDPKLLVLLDLDFNGDKHKGLNFCRDIKHGKDDRLKRIPVVIYSNTDDPKEIIECYTALANSFVWKGGPNGDDQRARLFKLLDFWLNTASTPLLTN
jgi:DNA-binding NarL/FixJ family response regulator